MFSDREDDFVIVPSGPVPGQVGRVFTILALTESGSFTDPDRAPLLTRIKYSSEQASVRVSYQGRASAEKRTRGPTRKNIVLCLCMWVAYGLVSGATSIINPFFPQIVSIVYNSTNCVF